MRKEKDVTSLPKSAPAGYNGVMRYPKTAITFALGLTGIGLLVYWQCHPGRDPTKTAGAERLRARKLALEDAEPHQPACGFWAPWRKLVAPGSPDAYLAAIKKRLDEPSLASGEYRNLIDREHSVLDGATESLCIKGRFTDGGEYKLDAGDIADCDVVPTKFLDLNFAISVERIPDQGFINQLTVNVGMENITPEAMLKFLADEAKMVKDGYHGWSTAFPAFYKLNTAGFGPIGFESAEDGSGKMKYAFLTQPLRNWQPKWADYLMQLSDLVAVRTTFGGDKMAPLLQTKLETVLSGLEIDVPEEGVRFMETPTTLPLVVSHDVLVRFRGLEILLQGMRFSGAFNPSATAVSYEGKFEGVSKVSLDGDYRGFVGGSLGKAIKEMVAEKVQEEVNHLMQGNRGKGWDFALSHRTVDGGNVFTYKTSLQSPVNFLNLVREDKDNVDSPVMPDKLALQGMNRWAAASVDALLQDYAAHPCHETAAVTP